MDDQEEEQSKFSALIGLIYDSANNPELWPELLSNLDTLLETDATLTKNGGVYVLTDEQPQISLLREHFKRALSLNNKIFRLNSELNAVSGILDRLPIGVILINTEKNPVAMNHHARTVIKLGNALVVRDGVLEARTQKDTARLNEIIDQLAMNQSPKDTIPQQSLLLTSQKGEPYSIWVTPSSATKIRADEPLIAIFISSSTIRQTISVNTLAKAYALTQAEARLLKSLLVDGCHSLSDAAIELGVSKHTVRTQMKVILDKTGTHSQTELLKKVFSGPAVMIGKQRSVEKIVNLKELEHDNIEPNLIIMKTLRLFDGRTLEYAEYGDPQGEPIIFLHSLLHSRKRMHPFYSYTEKCGIRIIAPERPGFGHSHVQPEHSLLAYAKDIHQLANKLGLQCFDIVGDGTGGPFALACAAELGDLIRNTALISCMPDATFDEFEGLIPFERMLLSMCKATPASFHLSFGRIMIKGMQKKPEKYYDRMYEYLADADQRIVSMPEKRDIFMESINNSFPNLTQPFIDDYLFRLKRWDFKPQDIQNKIHLWHGTENKIISIKSAVKLASMLPNCQAHFLDGQGHYIFITHWDVILKKLLNQNP